MQRPGPPKKKKRRRVWKLFQKQDCLAVLKDLELCTGDGWLKTVPQWSQLHPQSFFLSSNVECQDLVHQKKREKNYFVSKTAMLLQTDVKLCTVFHPLSTFTEKPGESVKLFSKLDYLATQSRFWNAFQRWVKSCWLMNLATLNGSWTMYQRSLTSCWPIIESAWPVKPLLTLDQILDFL